MKTDNTIIASNLPKLSEAISDALYRVQDERDKAQPGSDNKKALRKASHLLDGLMNRVNDLAALADTSEVVRQAMEEPNVEQS